MVAMEKWEKFLLKKYFILKLDSYEGDGSSLTVDADGADSMYVVLSVEGSSAENCRLGLFHG